MSEKKFEFEGIGTHWTLDIYRWPENLAEEQVLERIKQRIEDFDLIYSRFRSDSWVSQIRNKPGKHKLPKDAQSLFELYQKLNRLTGGFFTPMIGKSLEEAGYDATYSLVPKVLTEVTPFEKAAEINFETKEIEINIPEILDFGAAGKGYLIDLVADELERLGVKDYCVEAGGDMFYHRSNSEKLKVGLEHPENFGQVIGVAEIFNQSICGSAGNRRKWAEFHHILNPFTLKPANDILATWTTAKTALVADALATCLFFVPPEKLASEYDFEYLIVYPDLTAKKSASFSGEIFTTY
jgi:thiamine biosynthesis lipoprotein